MLTYEKIKEAAEQVALSYPLTKISYFGSYANGNATEKSDLDILVEFATEAVSLYVLAGVKFAFEDILHIPVDVLHAPIPKDSLLSINREIIVYG
jgi:predicted nucleotidyltransferase